MRALYRVWVADELEEDSNKEISAYDPVSAAIEYAGWCHGNRDGYDWAWPVNFYVRELRSSVEAIGVKRDYSGPVRRFTVARESVPEFYADKRTVEPTPPGIHDRFNKDGDPICLCVHPFAHAAECDQCLCASEKRFWHAMDGGCDWWLVARDPAHCKEILVKAGATFCDDDGNEINAYEHPEKIDECIDFDEVPQETARRMKPEDDNRKKVPLTDHELGSWFSSEY